MDQQPAGSTNMPAGAIAADASEQPQVYLAIVDEAARRMGADPAAVRGHSRAQPVADARHAAFWALAQAGLRPATIARLFNLNHSTVVHGLARAEDQPQWQAVVLPAVALAGRSGPAEALRVRLERALPPAVREPVLAYLWCTLLGWTHAPAPNCAQGLWLLAHHAAYRRIVEEGLRRCGLGAQSARITMQARRLGYLASMDASCMQREESGV